MPHEANPYAGHVDWISGRWLRHKTPSFNLRVSFPDDACPLPARPYACTHTHTRTHTHTHISHLRPQLPGGSPAPPCRKVGRDASWRRPPLLPRPTSPRCVKAAAAGRQTGARHILHGACNASTAAASLSCRAQPTYTHARTRNHAFTRPPRMLACCPALPLL